MNALLSMGISGRLLFSHCFGSALVPHQPVNMDWGASRVYNLALCMLYSETVAAAG